MWRSCSRKALLQRLIISVLLVGECTGFKLYMYHWSELVGKAPKGGVQLPMVQDKTCRNGAPLTKTIYRLERDLPAYLSKPVFSQGFRTRYEFTVDPTEADLFYVPAMPYCAENTEGFMAAVVGALEAAGPWWGRRGGADHVWTFSADHGFCGFGPGERGLPLLQRSIIVTHWGLHHPEHRDGLVCFNASKDIVVPPSFSLHNLLRPKNFRLPARFNPREARAEQEQGAEEEERNVLLSFAGSSGLQAPHRSAHYSHGTRQMLFRMFADRQQYPRFELSEKSSSETIEDLTGPLLRSVFCFTPSGGGWGIRLFLAVQYGCIPVIIQDDVHQAFDMHLPYHKFAVMMPQYRMYDLYDHLQRLEGNRRQLEAMYRTLECVKAYLNWEFNVDRAEGGKAGHLLLQILSERVSQSPSQMICDD